MVGVAVKLLGKKNEERPKMALLDIAAADSDRSPEEEP
jgi:hypothetical protein